MTALKVSTITDLQVEVARARQKFPTHESDYQIATALAEEVGELCKELLQLVEKPPRPQDAFARAERAYREAIQVACVAVRFAEEARCLADYQKKRGLLKRDADSLPARATDGDYELPGRPTEQKAGPGRIALPGVTEARKRSYGQRHANHTQDPARWSPARSELPTLPEECPDCGTVHNESDSCPADRYQY